MAKPSKKNDKTNDEDSGSMSPEEILGAYLNDKANKQKHLNNIEQIDYNVSTGSLLWDIYTNGGLPPGMHRLIGPPESGKSSAALEICRNFLDKLPKEGLRARGLYIKAEGRLSKEMRARCGLKFVWKWEDWVDGTIFVLESNNYELVINLLRRLLIVENQTHHYCIIFDSMDGLILDGDVNKESGENDKVAGAPKLTKQFLQKMGNYIGARGHICLMLGQFSTNIAMDTYASPENRRSTQGGGGWAAAHYAHYVFVFGEAFNQDLIKEVEKLPPSPTNKILGKRVKVKFKKSPNEKTGMEISYPIQYGVVGKSSIWSAVEVIDVMKTLSMIGGGTWIPFPEKLRKEAAEAGIDIPEKFNGERKLIAWFEANDDATRFLSDKFKKTLLVESSVDGLGDDETEKAGE